jgi:hypothetical protein
MLAANAAPAFRTTLRDTMPRSLSIIFANDLNSPKGDPGQVTLA